MQIIINVPSGFGADVNDKFQDFFKRLEVETKEHLMTNTSLLCGTYELETIEMFLDAFKEMKIIPDNATDEDVIKIVETSEPPTQRQRYFARVIEDVTGAPLPDMKTKQTYSLYISKNLEAYKRKKRQDRDIEYYDWENEFLNG